MWPELMTGPGPANGLIIVDADQRVSLWSDGVSKLLGLVGAEVRGKPIGEVLSLGLPDFEPPQLLDQLVGAVGNAGA